MYRPESHFIAADGECWIGYANLFSPEEGLLYHNGTGVDRAYRGRHVALALKLLTIRYARARGTTRLVTNNDSTKAPMLAINRKLGYQPQPGYYLLVQDLAR